MKTSKPRENKDTMREEYDFSNGERGRYAKRFAEGTNIVVLAPDLARRFKSSTAVNRALRIFVLEHGAPRRSVAKRSAKR
jgi:hypothetical protein